MAADRDLKLSEHFRLGQFLVDPNFPDLAKELEPGPQILDNLRRLTRLLDSVVERFPPSVEILSGYRDQRLNDACRAAGLPASVNSLHLSGCAADIKPTGEQTDLETIYEWLTASADELALNEAVYYPKKGFLHVAVVNPEDPQPRRILMRT